MEQLGGLAGMDPGGLACGEKATRPQVVVEQPEDYGVLDERRNRRAFREQRIGPLGSEALEVVPAPALGAEMGLQLSRDGGQDVLVKDALQDGVAVGIQLQAGQLSIPRNSSVVSTAWPNDGQFVLIVASISS